MAAPRIVNLDSLIAAELEQNVSAAVVVPFEMFGRTWHATNAASVTVLLTTLDVSAIEHGGGNMLTWLLSMIVPEEVDEFRMAINATPGIDWLILQKIIDKVSELTAGHPTEPSSGSSTSSATRKSSARSTGNSSSPAKAASRR